MVGESAKKVEHRGYQIAYEVVGEGPAVVYQHAFFSHRRACLSSGLAPPLTEGYRLILVDSLGHGDSDKPDDPPAYCREQRAGDIAAVLDQEGIDRAHYAGFSMAAWIGTGLAIHHPHRLLSLTIGGWDPVDGPQTFAEELGGPMAFETALKYATARAPDLMAWVTDEVKPGLAACFTAMGEVDGAPEAIRNCGVPVFLPNGVDDPYHDAAKAFAATTDNAVFLSLPGDHMKALMENGAGVGRAIREFLDRVPR